MKKSAIEAGVWGKKSLKHLESKELKWIHDRVCDRKLKMNNNATVLISLVEYTIILLYSRYCLSVHS